MVNRKGWLKLLEAMLAIIIIFGVILVISSRKPIQTREDLSDTITPILDELAGNIVYREMIGRYDLASSSSPTNAEIIKNLTDFVRTRNHNPYFNYTVKICETSKVCGINNPQDSDGEIYTGERIISSSLGSFDPVKLKIFLWRKTYG